MLELDLIYVYTSHFFQYNSALYWEKAKQEKQLHYASKLIGSRFKVFQGK